MPEPNLFRNTATKHHGKHHGPTVPDVPSKDGNNPIPEPRPEDNKRGHRKDDKRPKERKTKMRNRIAPTMTALAIALLFVTNLPGKSPFVPKPHPRPAVTFPATKAPKAGRPVSAPAAPVDPDEPISAPPV